jgi:hypothetical protein
MNAPWNAYCAEAIGVPWLLDAIAPSGALGRRARQRERTFRPGDEAVARAALERVDRLAREHDAASLATLRATIGAAPDPGAALVRARAGGVLGDVDFFELQRFAGALAAAGLLPAQSVLRERLAPGGTNDRTFYLADAFDAGLAAARAEAAARQAAYDTARSGLAARVARYAGVESVRDGEFVLMRDRLRGPLPAEIRVLREFPTYLLCEISLDDDALAALTARDAATAQVAQAEEDVRARLSAFVAAEAEGLERASDALGDLDMLVARAQFVQTYACVVPEVVDTPTLGLRSPSTSKAWAS